MKYQAVIMVPTIVEFKNPGSDVHVGNQAHVLCNNYQKIKLGDIIFEPRLAAVYPCGDKPEPLFFDPPPQAA